MDPNKKVYGGLTVADLDALKDVRINGVTYHIIRHDQSERSLYDFDCLDILVTDDSERVGYVGFSGTEDVGKIGGIDVENTYLKKGFGELLARHAFNDLLQRGVTRVGLNARAETNADKFWYHLGEKEDFPYEVRERTDEDDDVPQDIFISGPQLVAHLKGE